MQRSGPPSRLRVVYRSYAGDNTKPRPPFYSKLLALVSMLRAAEALTPAPELVFVNDGRMPADGRLEVMEKFGEVVPVVRGGSDARSFREMLAREVTLPGADDDLIWFSEDDYLYLPNALQALASGGAAFPQADYLTIYGSKALDVARSGIRPFRRPEPGAEGDPNAQTIDDVAWFRALSTTSTFGVRRRILKEDVRLLRMCALTGGSWDYSTCLTFQGYQPFSLAELRRDLLPTAVPPAQWPHAMARGGMRLLPTARALRRPSRRRILLGTDPELVFHMEAEEVYPRQLSKATCATDWPSIAADTVEWAKLKDIQVPLSAAT